MEINNNKLKNCIHFLYRYNIRVCCDLISIVVVFLAFYNHAKIKEYKNKQTKLDSVLAKHDSIKHEIDKDLKTLKEVLDSTIIKEK